MLQANIHAIACCFGRRFPGPHLQRCSWVKCRCVEVSLSSGPVDSLLEFKGASASVHPILLVVFQAVFQGLTFQVVAHAVDVKKYANFRQAWISSIAQFSFLLLGCLLSSCLFFPFIPLLFLLSAVFLRKICLCSCQIHARSQR